MIVVVTSAAAAELEAIGDYIAKDKPGRALGFIQEIRARCEALGDHPRRFPLVPRYEASGIRRCVHGNYLIFYRVTADIVEIVHILPGSRNYEPLLFQQDS